MQYTGLAYHSVIHSISYQKVIQLDPNYVKAWNNKGDALIDLGKYEEAVNWLAILINY